MPKPSERAHIMLEAAALWAAVPRGAHDKRFAGYPDQSIEDWHEARGLSVP